LSTIKPGLGNPKPKFDETFRLARVRFCLPVFWPVFGFGFVCPFLPSLHVLPRFCLKMLVFFIVFALFCLDRSVLPKFARNCLFLFVVIVLPNSVSDFKKKHRKNCEKLP
jgi:hypothetical protein